MTMKQSIKKILVIGALLIAPAQISLAQSNPFAAAVTVDNRAVTYFEIEQRAAFLDVLRAPGNVLKTARETLVNERLQLNAAQSLGIQINQEELAVGMAEFAKRANLKTAEFIKAIGQDGIEPETFQDFVRAGLTWRKLVQNRFVGRAQVSEDEIDRALALSSRKGGARVLLSEIVLPARNPEEAEASKNLAAELKDTIKTQSAFESAARTYSVSGSAANGGRITWLPLANLPPSIVPVLLTLKPGEVSDTVPVENAISMFQVRGLQEFDAPRLTTLSVEYATILFGGADSGAAQIAAKNLADTIDTCDDIYGFTNKNPEAAFAREVLPVGKIPQDVALELAKMDKNEISTSLRRNNGTALLFVMMCGRTPELTEGSRDEMRASLINRRIETYANNYLEDLRADSIIVEK